MLRGVRIRTLAGLLALTLAACGQAEAPSSEPPAPSASEQSPGATATDPNSEFCAEIGRRVSAADCADLSALAEQAQQGVAAFNAPNPMRRGDVHTLQLAVSFAPTPEQVAARELAEARAEAERLAQEYEAARAAAATTGGPSPAQPGGGDPRLARVQELREQTTQANERVAQMQAQLDAVRSNLDGDQPAPSTTTELPPTPEDVVDPLQGQTETFTPLVGRFMRVELSGNGFDITPLSNASQEVMRDSVTTWSWRVQANEGGQRALTLRTVVEGCTAEGQCYPLRSTSQNYDVTVEVGAMGQVQDFLTAAPVWLRLLAGVLTALAVLIAAWFGLRNAFRKGRAGA